MQGHRNEIATSEVRKELYSLNCGLHYTTEREKWMNDAKIIERGFSQHTSVVPAFSFEVGKYQIRYRNFLISMLAAATKKVYVILCKGAKRSKKSCPKYKARRLLDIYVAIL